jgi:hypothetical protein
MTPREERGLIIAAMCKLNRKGGEWFVPSQSNGELNYRVNVGAQTCTCPDHADTGFKCKHLFAVEFTMKREHHTDGTVTETESITFTKKVTYKQDWPAYTKAQNREKDRIQELLSELVMQVEEPKHDGIGRQAHSRRDTIFAMVFKVYSTFSARRFGSDMRERRSNAAT